ncbi:MAG TPA: hypothetical protein VG712_03260 [Gemmatimonadales bacterium]|nr:hypothetical protein [Gemmatimonadales bacterium]
MSTDRFRGLKAVLKNALLWGATLGVTGGGLVGLYVLIVARPGVESLPERIGEALFAAVAMGVRFAVAGAIMGTLFASVIRFGFRGRRVADLSIGRSALVGALVGGIGIPLVYQFLNILSGDGPVAWKYLFDDIPWAATFGAGAAAATIWMARRAAAVGAGDEAAQLRAPDAFDASPTIRERERSSSSRPER